MIGVHELADEFRARFGASPRIYRAPGRVNLIGEHTDYNDGLVMPMAIQFYTLVAIAPRADRVLRVHSVNFGETIEFRLPTHWQASPPRPVPEHWSNYVCGVALWLGRAGVVTAGADLLIHGAVPIGSGLSSSAALEVAAAYALADLAGTPPDRTALALLCQQVENDYVGTRCGIMDQFTSACARAEQALCLDCRALTCRFVPIKNVAVVVCNTMVRHRLASGEYNRRRAECERGVAALAAGRRGVTALRDVSAEALQARVHEMDPVIYRRCRHVIDEIGRVEALRQALDSGDLAAAGALMGASHRSLRDDFEVSCAELDLMVRLAEGLPGVYGARMTGGGFGGCVVCLVAPEAATSFRAAISERYEQLTGWRPETYACEASQGAGRVQ